MECRGVIGAYDQRTDSVTIWSSTQVVHWVRREAAAILRLPELRVRCVALDVGGGFGTKGHVYPEDMLIPFLARLVGRPVRWIEERQEHFVCSCHSRDQLHEVEVGFDDEARIIAFRDDFLVDCGAWNPVGAGIAYNTPSICSAHTRLRTSQLLRVSPLRIKFRLHRIEAQAGRKRRLRWNGQWT